LKPTRNSISITIYTEFEAQDEKNRTMAISEPSSVRLYNSKFPDFVICPPSISFIMPSSSGRLILRPNPGFLFLSSFLSNAPGAKGQVGEALTNKNLEQLVSVLTIAARNSIILTQDSCHAKCQSSSTIQDRF
jgi:hypothetical protein